MEYSSDFRKLIDLFEARNLDNPKIEYDDSQAGKVIAKLRSHNSATYTKLAQRLARIDELEAEVKYLKEAVKTDTKDNIIDLFDVDDAVNTRVIETLQFVFTLSKDPKVTVSPKYKDILEELTTHLTPQLITILEGLKDRLKTETQKSPSLRVNKIEESDSQLKKYTIAVTPQEYADLKAGGLRFWNYKYEPNSGELTFETQFPKKMFAYLDQHLDFANSYSEIIELMSSKPNQRKNVVKESSIMSDPTRFKNAVEKWGENYDSLLDNLIQEFESIS